MSEDANQFLQLLRSPLILFKPRLSIKIVCWVFFCIVAIEAIILIPSVRRRERELLTRQREIAAGKVGLLADTSDANASSQELLAQFSNLASSKTIPGDISNLNAGNVNQTEFAPTILGGALYTQEGDLVGNFGETPELQFEQVANTDATALRNDNGTRYDVAWSPGKLGNEHVLVVRIDSTPVKDEYYAFIWRIAGLVLIIGLFTTVGSLVSLWLIVINPILQLRQDLIAAGDAVKEDREPPEFHCNSSQRRDELGDVIAAFFQMFRKISETIDERKQAQAALQESLIKVEAYSSALNHELEKGRQMQLGFLPSTITQKTGWEVAAFFKPAKQVAGDFYDVFELPGDRLGLVIADVCDKGVGAALFMALFRSLIRIFSGQTVLDGLVLSNGRGMDDSQIANMNEHALKSISLTNDYIAINHAELGMFATLFFGVLEPNTGKLTYINGGHEPLFILHPNGGIRGELNSSGPAVGIIPQATFKIGEAQLEPGEMLIGYTDGVPEARDADSKFFTTDRLRQILAKPPKSAKELTAEISGLVLEHTGTAEQFDDVTLIAVKRQG
ncbi:protein serine/threonine phosphatase [Thalassoporum mexicanum PCC 7367]|uniref:PP2C family protein-serine/threonine phosphatase n=1 Tax=Thalassoporum mexicanum TaxID=3457544 RepID=UPI00029F8CF8|nr:PP2C family protein-serine/threonine phosphatase [Pseudanabaena sp. PCC 7367]AFY70827.1 protein serine/threonine phosphatase [Pseudanabaena sp. PCC 7367]